MTKSPVSLAKYASRVGQVVDVSDWIEMNQQMIEAFAETTLDDQGIYVAPVCTSDSAFDGAIAHGF